MKSKVFAYLIMSVFLISIIGSFTAISASATTSSVTINVTEIGPYSTIINDARFHGPCDAIMRCPNGDLLLVDRNGTSHVSAGDYGVLTLYRSTNNGVSWARQTTIQTSNDMNVSIAHRDIRNYACGVDLSGELWIFFSAYDCDNGTTIGSLKYFTMYSMHAGNNGLAGEWWPPALRAANTSPYGSLVRVGDTVGFTAYTCNGSVDKQTRAMWYYSTVPTSYWSAAPITFYGDSGGINEPSEASVAAIGGNNLIALTRVDGSTSLVVSHSMNKGSSWSVEPVLKDFGLPYSKPPVLITQNDSHGRMMIVSLFNYNQYYSSHAYASNLLTDSWSAWSVATPINSGSTNGIYAYPVWDSAASDWLVLTSTNTLTSDITSHHIKITTTQTFDQRLADKYPNPTIRSIISLIPVFLGLLLALPVIGIIVSAHSGEKMNANMLVGVVVYLIVGSILIVLAMKILSG